MLWVDVDSEFVVSSSEVLDKGVPGTDHAGGAESFQSAHWTQPRVRCQNAMQLCDLVFICGWLGWLGRAPVLVDQSAEYSVTSDWGIEGNHGGRIVGRRVLVNSLVRPVVIEMA